MLKKLEGHNIGTLLESTLPSRKTSMFFALLILALAQVNLLLDKIGSGEWLSICMFVLTAYAVKRYKQSQLNAANGNGDPPT